MARNAILVLGGWLLVAAGCASGGSAASSGGASGDASGGRSGSGGSRAGGSGGLAGTSDAMSLGGSGDGGGPGTSKPPSTGGAGGGADAAPGTVGAGLQVTVAAGEHDRKGTVVSFPLGAAHAGKTLVLSGHSQSLSLQVDDAGQAVFVLPSLKAGTEAVFTIGEAAPASPVMTALRESDGVTINLGDRTVLRYQMQGKLPGGVGPAYLRGGYLHPIYTPAAVLVTDDYPGDHRHHHGIWSAWAATTFEGRHIDFWNMGQRTAKVDFEGLDATWDGRVHAGLRARQVHVDLSGGGPKTALKEEWVVTAYRVDGASDVAPPPYFLFDLVSTQETGSSSPVMLDRYIYGGFGLRGHASWAGAGGATFLTAEGRTRANGNGTTTRWCHIGGRVNGAPVGYAALGHPSNFRAPQPVRINPTDPFFSIAPVQPSGFSIEPGKRYVSRYRIVVTDGPADKALLDRLWNDYATPPSVTVR